MTEDRIRQRFDELFRLIPEPYQSVMQSGRQKGMKIVTDESEIDHEIFGEVSIAATIGGLFYFRPSRITEDSLDEVLLHEQMHFYVEQRDKLQYRDFQIHLLMSPLEISRVKELKRRNEDEVKALTKKILHRIRDSK